MDKPKKIVRLPIGKVASKAKTWNPARERPGEYFTYVDLSSVDQSTKSIVDACDVLGSEAPSRARQIIEANNILVATVRPNLNGVARVPVELDGATASTGFCVIKPDQDKLDAGYLFHWVKTPQFVSDMVRKSTGANYPAVSDRIIFESTIPLPPLSEQKRIAEILDRAEALRAKRRAALALLDELTQSIFLDMFGDPVGNPKCWPRSLLKELFNFTTGKLDSNAAKPDGPYPFFTCSREDARIDTFAFDCEALLLAGNNANADYSVKHFTGKFNAYQRTYVITLKDESNSYCYAKMMLQNKLAELKRFSKGTNTKYLTLELLNRITFSLPPTSLQHEFESRLKAVESLKAFHFRSLEHLELLFASLQHRAFRGQL